MINNLSIILSLFGVGYVVMRAIVYDKLNPWFGIKPKPVHFLRRN